MKGFGYFDSFEDLMETANIVGKGDLVPDEDIDPEGELDRVAVPNMSTGYDQEDDIDIEVDDDDVPMGGDVNGFDKAGKTVGSAGTANEPGEGTANEPGEKEVLFGGLESALEITEAFEPGELVDDVAEKRARAGKTDLSRTKLTVDFDPNDPNVDGVTNHLNSILDKRSPRAKVAPKKGK